MQCQLGSQNSKARASKFSFVIPQVLQIPIEGCVCSRGTTLTQQLMDAISYNLANSATNIARRSTLDAQRGYDMNAAITLLAQNRTRPWWICRGTLRPSCWRPCRSTSKTGQRGDGDVLWLELVSFALEILFRFNRDLRLLHQ